MIPKLEDCAPGLRPTGYNVLVAVDEVQKVTAGGIHLPGQHIERETSAAERGRLVEASPMAFKGGDWGECDAVPVGAEVLFQRYAGNEFEGRDGRKYRVMSDTDLKGVFA
jgi:co-chaperonin GroES (HSP10)